jgi:hypothetical protein
VSRTEKRRGEKQAAGLLVREEGERLIEVSIGTAAADPTGMDAVFGVSGPLGVLGLIR